MTRIFGIAAILLLVTSTSFGEETIDEAYVVNRLGGTKGSSLTILSPSESMGTRQGALTAPFSIYFDFNSTELNEASRESLLAKGRSLEVDARNGKKFILIGHTDSVGSIEYNIELSRQRAELVKKFLTTQFAIAPDRLSVVYMGESSPILYSGLQADKARCRRVEIVRVE